MASVASDTDPVFGVAKRYQKSNGLSLALGNLVGILKRKRKKVTMLPEESSEEKAAPN